MMEASKFSSTQSAGIATPETDLPAPRIRVLIAYQHLPHYRYDVFKALECNDRLIVEFAADTHSLDGSIPTIPFAMLARVRRLRNIRIGPFLWQVGLVSGVVRGGYDVVLYLGDASYLSTWVSAAVSRLLRIPVLFWTIGWHRPEHGIRRLFRLTFYHLANHLLLYGSVARELGGELGYPLNRMTVIRNSSSEPIPGEHKSDRTVDEFIALLPNLGHPVVTAVIRLNRVKRLDLIIDALSLLPPGDSKPSLLLVGEGPERERLMTLAASLGVDLFAPGTAYNSEELMAVYARTTVTVVPSAAGLTVLQSFKHGRPVITHDNVYEQMPEAEAILPGITGDLYHYGDVRDLSRKIENWIAIQSLHSTDTARACRRVVEEDWSASSQAGVIGDQIQKAFRRTTGNFRTSE